MTYGNGRQHDFKPEARYVFRERLYAIQWITRETIDSPRQETYFSAVTDADLARERG